MDRSALSLRIRLLVVGTLVAMGIIMTNHMLLYHGLMGNDTTSILVMTAFDLAAIALATVGAVLVATYKK